MNIVSAALAITAIVLYSVDLAEGRYNYWCNRPEHQKDNLYSWTTATPSKKAEWDKTFEKQLENYRVCEENWYLMKVITFVNFRQKVVFDL